MFLMRMLRSPNINLFLNPVGVFEVQLYLQSLASKKAAAADEIPMFLVKRVARRVASPLAEKLIILLLRREFFLTAVNHNSII
jgi:hypothetical protein